MKNPMRELSLEKEFVYSKKTDGNYGKFWFERYKKGQELYQRFAFAKYKTVDSKLPGGGGKLLDVGCGFGDALFLYQKKFDQVIGIDPSLEMVDICKFNILKRCRNASVLHGDCEHLKFHDSEFDVVLLLDVFEHLHSDSIVRSLSEINRVLAPGGKLIIVTPSRQRIKVWAYFDNLLRKLLVDWATSIFQLPVKTHTEIFYSKKEVIGIALKNNFELSKFEFTAFYPAPERLSILNRVYRRVMHISLFRKTITVIFVVCETLPFLRQKMFFEFVKARNQS